jgi:hypothetical protein
MNDSRGILTQQGLRPQSEVVWSRIKEGCIILNAVVTGTFEGKGDNPLFILCIHLSTVHTALPV